MNRKWIAGVFFVFCFFALFPSIPGIVFLSSGLLFCPSSFQAWAGLILFCGGLVLMWGYGQIARGRISLDHEGWIWFGSVFLNVVLLALAGCFPEPERNIYSEVFVREWPDTVADNLGHLAEIFLVLWWVVAVFLSAIAFVQWIQEFHRWQNPFQRRPVSL